MIHLAGRAAVLLGRVDRGQVAEHDDRVVALFARSRCGSKRAHPAADPGRADRLGARSISSAVAAISARTRRLSRPTLPGRSCPGRSPAPAGRVPETGPSSRTARSAGSRRPGSRAVAAVAPTTASTSGAHRSDSRRRLARTSRTPAAGRRRAAAATPRAPTVRLDVEQRPARYVRVLRHGQQRDEPGERLPRASGRVFMALPQPVALLRGSTSMISCRVRRPVRSDAEHRLGQRVLRSSAPSAAGCVEAGFTEHHLGDRGHQPLRVAVIDGGELLRGWAAAGRSPVGDELARLVAVLAHQRRRRRRRRRRPVRRPRGSPCGRPDRRPRPGWRRSRPGRSTRAGGPARARPSAAASRRSSIATSVPCAPS